ncbi:hypothetical protein HYDPIDRAFT_31996 [Hydnomerulius pinastri MD-312]|uniref:Transmembrane protein n=1 Tax=Hydnomerulius pinastri MD-312 TaxID=994086 RepID=A0A0C9WBF8_9AGAM|nr:hypothetical protein HYDPIDRAFT_31996 [Hydnomerulius pinastri MD-312]
MSDGEQEQVRRWLTDDNAVLNGVLIVAASSVALVFASLCVWRAKHHHVHAEPTSTKDHQEHLDSSSLSNLSTAQSVLSAALTSLHIVSVTPGEYGMTPAGQAIPSDASSTLDVEQKDRKGLRSKERRRRGKDPYKELLKGGKKSKTLLKTNKADDDDDADHSRSVSPFTEAESKSNTSGNDNLLSTSRSQSQDTLSRELFDDEQVTPSASAAPRAEVSLDGGVKSVTPVISPSPASVTLPSSNASSLCSALHRSSHPDTAGSQPPSPRDSTTPDANANLPSSPSLKGTETCPPDPSPPSEPLGSRNMHPAQCSQNFPSNPPIWEGGSQAESSGANCTKLPRFRSKPRAAASENIEKPQTPPSTEPYPSSNGVSSPSLPETESSPSSSRSSTYMPPVTFPSLNPLPVDMGDFPSSTPVNNAGPSTPAVQRGSTPPPSRSRPESTPPPQLPGQAQFSSQASSQTGTQVSAQTQLASMRGALEAARLREEKSRAEAERASNECEEIRWRWNEDAGAWRRRETELQTQMHHLMQQLQAYAAILASFQSQQRPSSSFSSPTSPSPHTHPHSSPRLQHHPLAPFPLPPLQSQNPASAPAHVQALLASTPMLSSHHQGFGMHSGMGTAGMSPLLWSGLGFSGPGRSGTRGPGQHTPDSSASGSPSRGRRRRRQAEDVRSASDDSSLGDWDGIEESSGPDNDEGDRWERGEDPWEEEGDIFRNNVLADAILKRPESIRGLSSVGKRSGSGRVPSRTSVRSDGGVGAPVVPLANRVKREEVIMNEHSELVRATVGGDAEVPEDQEAAWEKPNVITPTDDDPAANTPPGPDTDKQ